MSPEGFRRSIKVDSRNRIVGLMEKITTATIREKIPADKCWAMTTKILTTIITLRGSKDMAPLLGEGEGIIAPVWGWEKYLEINTKIFGEGSKRFYPWVKEAFNIPVEDAIGAVKLLIVSAIIAFGPLTDIEIVEATREKAVVRWIKCPFGENNKKFEYKPELWVCPTAHQVRGEEGLKAINPKLTHKLTKALPRDPYCEAVIEFKGD